MESILSKLPNPVEAIQSYHAVSDALDGKPFPDGFVPESPLQCPALSSSSWIHIFTNMLSDDKSWTYRIV